MQVWTQDENRAAPHAERSYEAKAVAGPSKLVPGPSARKALGNITNQQGKRTPAAALAPCKALGDMMSATPAATKRELRKGSTARPAARPAAVASTATAPGSPEALAGMGWRELEAARQAQTSSEISARLAAIAAAPSFNPFFQQEMWRVSAPGGCEECARPPSQAASPAKEPQGLAADAAADGLDVYRDDWSLDIPSD